jgi:glycosyltransferase involved in cell wall biosynthesis
VADTLRVLIVSLAPFPTATGEATRVAQRIVALSAAGHEIDVLTPRSGDLPHVSKYLQARILRVPVGKRAQTAEERSDTFDRALRRQLATNDYDLIHAMTPYVGPAIGAVPPQTRLVYEAPLRLAAGRGSFERRLRERHRALLARADLVLAATFSHMAALTESGAAESKLELLRPSVDLDLFSPGNVSTGGRLRVAVAANDLSHDDQTWWGEALASIAGRVPLTLKLSVSMRRSGPWSALEQAGGSIEWHTPVVYDELPPFYRDADVGLVPEGEGEPAGPRLQVLAEQMASGLAVVTPDSAEAREVLEVDREALFVPRHDVGALAHAVERLAVDARRRRMLGAAARRRACELLDERHAGSRLVEMYRTQRAEATQLILASALFAAPTGEGLEANHGPEQATLLDTRLAPQAVTTTARPPGLAARHRLGEESATTPEAAIHRRPAAQLSSAAVTLTDLSPLRPRR